MTIDDIEHFWAWLATGVATIVAAVGKAVHVLVRKWNNTRFEAIEVRVKEAEDDISEIRDRNIEQDRRLDSVNKDVEYIRETTTEIKDSIRRIHDKLDKLPRTINGSS